MPKVNEIVERNNTRIKETAGTCLDTLESTSEFFNSIAHESLYVRAVRKHSTNEKLLQIIDLPNIENYWINKMWDTWHCYRVLLKVGDNLQGTRCRNRWCQNCSRIKAADITNGYSEPLSEYKELYHVVLSKPNVKGRELRSEIGKMIKSFQVIKDTMRKAKIALNGFRKLECTHNVITNEFHPHFHILINGKEAAETLLKYWLKNNPTAKRDKGNMALKITDDNYMREIAKYAAKDPVKDEVSAQAALTMYKAMAGKRIYQPFGNLKKVILHETPTETKEQIDLKWLPENGVFVYDQKLKDWTEANGTKIVNTLDLEIILNDVQIKHSENATT